MGSFKVKLVVYFLLLSLLPLAAAFWGFSTVAARSETRRVDARLQAGLARDAGHVPGRARRRRRRRPRELARNPAFQRALIRRDRARDPAAPASDVRNLSVEAANGFQVGRIDPTAATRQVAVVGARRHARCGDRRRAARRSARRASRGPLGARARRARHPDRGPPRRRRARRQPRRPLRRSSPARPTR